MTLYRLLWLLALLGWSCGPKPEISERGASSEGGIEDPSLIQEYLDILAGVKQNLPNPNVILITMDTTRADRLGCYGSSVATPHIDALAAKGYRFENVISSAPVTGPSHASIFTSTFPLLHGVRDNGTYYLSPNNLTMAEIFQACGYRTGGFVSAFVLDPRFGFDQGFDAYDANFEGSRSTLKQGRHEWQGHNFGNFERTAEETNEMIFGWLDRITTEAPGEPIFLWAHYFDPHFPYTPRPPYDAMYRNRYHGEIAYMDAQIGLLMDKLEELGRMENSLVILTADHGESLGEHEKTHGKTLTESVIKVPLIIKPHGPEMAPVMVTVPQVRTIDILPTLCSFLEIPIPIFFQGRNLRDLIASPETYVQGEWLAYAETHCLERPYKGGIMHGLRTGDKMYLVRPKYQKELLFDLEIDPGQETNLIEARTEEAQQFRLLLQEVIARYSPKSGQAGIEVEADERTEEILRSLGYSQ